MQVNAYVHSRCDEWKMGSKQGNTEIVMSASWHLTVPCLGFKTRDSISVALGSAF